MDKLLENLIATHLGSKSAQVTIVAIDDCGPWWDIDLPACAEVFGLDMLVPVIGGSPLAVADIKRLSAEAHAKGQLLVVENTIATSAGCAALRLGADIVLEFLSHACGKRGEGYVAVACAHPLSHTTSDLKISKTDDLPDALRRELTAVYETFLYQRTQENDAALVVANYLVCHPQVEHVWYPGLLRDQHDFSRRETANALAPSILTGGFGPVLDYTVVGKTNKPIRYVAAPTEPIYQVEELEHSLSA